MIDICRLQLALKKQRILNLHLRIIMKKKYSSMKINYTNMILLLIILERVLKKLIKYLMIL